MDTEHPETIGKYEILGVIGKGAMGKVYKAAEPDTNRIVAIKVLPPEFADDPERAERFDREAQAVALLRHANVARIIERGEEGEQQYFVMEYIPGTSLEAILRQRRLSLPEAIRVFKAVCKGIEAAHQKSIVHRDLSPRNILVSEDLSTIKVVDFGISRVESISKVQGTLSTTEYSLGSLHYMAPEQARNMASADHRADIYSLGVLFYEMLTGRVPVGRFNLPSQLNSEVPPEVDPVVLRCLEADPQNRYASVARLLREVRRLEDQLRLGLVHEVRGIGTQTSKILLKSGGNRVTRFALYCLGAVILAGAGFLAFGSLTGAPESEDATAVLEAPEPAEPVAMEVDAESAEPYDRDDAPGDAGDGDLTTTAVEEASSPQAPTPEPVARTKVPTAAAAAAAAAATKASKSTFAKDLEVARNKLGAGLLDEAQSDLEQLLEKEPNEAVASMAYLLLGKTFERQQQGDKARATYVELESRYGSSAAAAEGAYRNAKLVQSEGGRDRLREATGILARVAERHADSPWAPRSLADKAAIETETKSTTRDLELKRQVPSALVTYRELVTRYPTDRTAEDAFWNLGEMYFDLKAFDLAAGAFESLATRFPSTRHEAWWRAGQVYDRRLDKKELAMAAYGKVPSGSRRHAEAQKRINKLSK